MSNWFLKLTERTNKKESNAFLISVILLVTLVTFDISSTYNYIRGQLPQLLYAMLLSYAATVATLIFIWLIRRGQVNIAVWGMVLTNLVALLLSPLLGS